MGVLVLLPAVPSSSKRRIGGVVVPGEVAHGAARTELVVRQAIESDGGIARSDRAQALERIEIEPHPQVEHLPALEATGLQVPAVPLADPQPEIVGVGATDVGPADRLIARPDQLDLPLNEVLPVEGVGRRHSN